MSTISQEFCKFLAQLEANNSKSWFDENRKRYETQIKKPFIALVADLLPHMQILDPQIQLLPKDAIFRINRDIRFSKDKSPYNTIMKAAFVRGGRKSNYAGFFLGISAEQLHVGGGAYSPDKTGIQAVRAAIAADLDGFAAIYQAPRFAEHFGPIKGSAIKRIPAEFKAAFKQEELIANKQWYVMHTENIHPLIQQERLQERILELSRIAAPLMTFLNSAIAKQS